MDNGTLDHSVSFKCCGALLLDNFNSTILVQSGALGALAHLGLIWHTGALTNLGSIYTLGTLNSPGYSCIGQFGGAMK